jgi:hypothetical protein
MPNRILRDWTNSDKVDALTAQAEVLFTRLIMKADDYGCFYADPRLLKSYLFPLKSGSIREADITRWLAECAKAGVIVLYEVDRKKYLQIFDFRQRLDKSKAKFPLPPDNQSRSESGEVDNDFPEVGTDSVPETEADTEPKTETNSKKANAFVGSGQKPLMQMRAEYSELVKRLNDEKADNTKIWVSLKTYIEENKPAWAEPYVDIWNLFATSRQLSRVEQVSDSRRKKIRTRLGESGFDFIAILAKIKASGHLKGNNKDGWKCTFDWLIENDSNYVKILEGNYD